MLGVKYKSDKRDQYLQHGGWFVKLALWVVCNVVPFLLPAGIVNSYGRGHTWETHGTDMIAYVEHCLTEASILAKF